ncbi:putative DNA-directed DNA polymerase [Helianthus debilis subsp. tardiflorus]
MHKVLINVPRVFYLNSKAPVTEQFPGRLVNKILPHGHNPYNLIEVVTDEDQFMTESRKLAAHLADPEVEGIYETKVGLDFNFILQIGCVCKVDKSVKKRNAQDGWSLSELHMKTTTECSYLASSISFFYLYHSISDQRGIYLVYFPSRSTTHAVMVTPVQNKELSPHILEKQFREACHALSVKPPMPRDAFTFKVDYVGKAKDAQKVLQRAISEIRSQLHGPVIAVVECPNVASVKSGIRALDDFPCVNILSNARDSQYPALGWQIVAAKIGMCRCATSSRWLNEKISLSRYSHVPVGNIELDWRIQTADIFFARVLRDQKQMLWVSDNGIPDLGGDNEEETCYFDEVNQPVLICDGAYRKVTVELKIHNLAVTALLVEFDEDLTLGSHELSELDEATPCVHAFRALRALIQRCVADAMLSGNIFADELSQHVYRWLCSPRSKLHDPALLRMLQKAMNKVLALLLREFRNLGSTIIFANYSKVILDTGKADLNAAQTYCGSLLKILQESTLFKWIELEPTQFWHSLLFMDQDHFTLIVSEFLYLPWKFAQDQASKRANVRDDDSCTPSITAAAAETFQSSFTEHLRKQIESYFTHKLLKIVSAIVLHVREKGKSHALELIKHVCAVLELDQNVQPEIQVMKKNLLKLVHVREFASEAQFQKCSIFFTLPNVICRDIDLRENSALLSQEWRCSVPECGQPYDREMMENSLLQIARQRERTYHLQDLVCLKCKQIKAAHLAEHCGCAGSFNLKESATLFKDKMEVLLNIAVYQKFELLKECVSWILELS